VKNRSQSMTAKRFRTGKITDFPPFDLCCLTGCQGSLVCKMNSRMPLSGPYNFAIDSGYFLSDQGPTRTSKPAWILPFVAITVKC
jgi:hypothetical protein